MPEQEINSYRLTSQEEPTDQMLATLMKEVAEKAKAKSEEAHKKFFQGVRHLIRQQATNRRKEFDDSCHKPVLIVIAGPNGSGKTSVTSQILQHEWMENSVYINPDHIAQEKFGDWNSREAIMQAAKYAEALRENCLVERKSLIFETVLSAEDKVDYICRAMNAGFFVRLFFICTASPAINASRIASRVLEGGHDVPISKIISRYQKSISNCCLLSKLVDRAYIYDNSREFKDAVLLFRLNESKLVQRTAEHIPEWAIPLYKDDL